MSIRTRKPLLVAACGLFAFATAACDTTLTLNDDQLEQTITQQFQAQTNVALTAIDCPSDRPLQTGDTFTCSATTELGESLTINVTQTDDQGNVNWTVAGG